MQGLITCPCDAMYFHDSSFDLEEAARRPCARPARPRPLVLASSEDSSRCEQNNDDMLPAAALVRALSAEGGLVCMYVRAACTRLALRLATPSL